MTTWLALGVLALLLLGCVGHVIRRDRRGRGAADDGAGARDARALRHGYEVWRHESQGQTWQRDRGGPS
ncbi:hypothetical protein [Micromonospora globbae]|jgi:hypothetical protein|uniref:hypothetical protein n=1 Tax=Micromonospora globbae TaxID=1894969 RepID=UPI00343E282A